METSLLVWNFTHEVNSPIRPWIMDDRRHLWWTGDIFWLILADFSKKSPEVHGWARLSSLLFFKNAWTLTDRNVVILTVCHCHCVGSTTRTSQNKLQTDDKKKKKKILNVCNSWVVASEAMMLTQHWQFKLMWQVTVRLTGCSGSTWTAASLNTNAERGPSKLGNTTTHKYTRKAWG